MVQHIQQLLVSPSSGAWGYSLTDEWPVPDERNQLSITIPLLHDAMGTGAGDVLFNYRRQLLRASDDFVIVTPRLSVWLPTGNAEVGRGTGGPGVQAQACVTLNPSTALALHSNLGAAVPISGEGTGPANTSVTLAQSIIWFPYDRLNFLLEARSNWPVLEALSGPRAVILSPGLRTAVDVASCVQIVPGAAVPLIFQSGEASWGMLFYLSVEHSIPCSKRRPEAPL